MAGLPANLVTTRRAILPTTFVEYSPKWLRSTSPSTLNGVWK